MVMPSKTGRTPATAPAAAKQNPSTVVPAVAAADPEAGTPPRRRTFSAKEKLRILTAADEAAASVDPARSALAEAGPGGGGALTVATSVLHVRSHLLVGDGFARHEGDLGLVTEIPVVPTRSGQHPHPAPHQEDERAAVSSLRPGYARPPAGDSGQDGCRRRTGWLSLISQLRVVIPIWLASLKIFEYFT